MRPCKYCIPYQNSSLDLVFINNSCLYSGSYRMMIYFQHSFHIYPLLFYCNQASFLLSCLFIFLFSVWTYELFSSTSTQALIYNSSNYFGAQIVLDFPSRSPLPSRWPVSVTCLFFFKSTSLLSDVFRIYFGLKIMTLGLTCSGYWSRLRESDSYS